VIARRGASARSCRSRRDRSSLPGQEGPDAVGFGGLDAVLRPRADPFGEGGVARQLLGSSTNRSGSDHRVLGTAPQDTSGRRALKGVAPSARVPAGIRPAPRRPPGRPSSAVARWPSGLPRGAYRDRQCRRREVAPTQERLPPSLRSVVTLTHSSVRLPRVTSSKRRAVRFGERRKVVGVDAETVQQERHDRSRAGERPDQRGDCGRRAHPSSASVGEAPKATFAMTPQRSSAVTERPLSAKRRPCW